MMPHAHGALAQDAAPNGWPWWVLRGFRAGESAALTEVYRGHVRDVTGQLRHGFSFSARGRAHRFAGYGSAFELQDALHETFRRAFEPRARQAYDGVRPYGPYLKTIARNIVLRAFRRREIQFPVARGGEDGEVEPVILADTDSVSPEDAVGGQQIRAIVGEYLETLAEVDRRLLQLRFIDGMSQRDAATTLGVGRQQVRGKEDKLRRGLLVFLRERGEVELAAGAGAVAVALAWWLFAHVGEWGGGG